MFSTVPADRFPLMFSNHSLPASWTVIERLAGTWVLARTSRRTVEANTSASFRVAKVLIDRLRSPVLSSPYRSFVEYRTTHASCSVPSFVFHFRRLTDIGCSPAFADILV